MHHVRVASGKRARCHHYVLPETNCNTINKSHTASIHACGFSSKQSYELRPFKFSVK